MNNISIENIYPYPDEKLTCFERPLYAYINWIEKDPTYLGTATWSFTYNYVKNFEGIRNNIPMEWIIAGVRTIYGIDMSVKKIPNVEEAIRTIKAEIEKQNPVMVYIDSFYCPWYPSYHKSHINHYILVIGISDDWELICLDKVKGDSIYKILPLADYRLGRKTNEVILFRWTNVNGNVDTKQATRQFLIKHLSVMENSQLFDNIRNYSNFIRNSFNIQEELKDVHDYRVASVYTWLKGISTSREKFAFALQKSAPNIPDTYLQDLIDISVQWRTVLLQLMLAKDRTIDYNLVADVILGIANKEECCFYKIKNRFYGVI